jgi:hypothetical protein
MAVYNEPKRPLEFIIAEGPGDISRESVTIASGSGDLIPGTLLGVVSSGAITATGTATTAGNGDFVAESVGAVAGAEAGDYMILARSATKADVYSPSGAFLGIHTIGTAWDANGIEFNTVGTWAAGDYAAIAVAIAAGSGEYAPFDPDATNGTATPSAILCYPVDATSAAVETTVLARLATIKLAAIEWPTGVSAGEKTTALAALANHYLIAR